MTVLFIIIAGMIIGFIYGCRVGLALPRLNSWQIPFYQKLLLGFYFGAIYSVLSLMIFVPLGILARIGQVILV